MKVAKAKGRLRGKQPKQARQLYTQSLEIFERLAAAEPERADYQNDLSIARLRLSGLDTGHKGRDRNKRRGRWPFRGRRRA